MIVTQEIIHTRSRKKGKMGFMAIKIDLEKAYDRLEWHFIRDMLKLFHFPQALIKLILSCISSSSISILFNGGKLEPFLPSRGIRQRDPLSPYLFILCMEMLGFLILGKCKEKLWDLMRASRNGPAFSHLFFTAIQSCLPKLIKKTTAILKRLWIPFMSYLGRKLVWLNARSISPQMSARSLEQRCVRCWVLILPLTQASTWGSLSDTKDHLPKTITLSLRESKTNFKVGKHECC